MRGIKILEVNCKSPNPLITENFTIRKSLGMTASQTSEIEGKIRK